MINFTFYLENLMVRISKQAERRAKCPHKPRPPAKKTGPKKDKLPKGFKPHVNAIANETMAQQIFIPKRIG